MMMNCRSRPQFGRAAILWMVVACLLIAGIVASLNWKSKVDSAQTVLLHRVERTDFEAFVTEPGDLVSSSNVEVRCQVKSRGSSGAFILKICEEGTRVEKGDFLVQFDDSSLQYEQIAQKIVVANDKSGLIQAESDLSNAERRLTEYVEGVFEQEAEVLEGQVFVNEEILRKNELELASTRRLAAKGMIKELQVSAAEFALEKARKDVAASRRALDVYRRFTRDRMIGEYKAEIEKQKANVEAAKFTLELSQQKLQEIDEQIAFCYVTAPTAGEVVHANERDRGEPQVIEEGSWIRFNQVVVRLPDARKMQVDVKINESHVNRISANQPARIILDADPENVLRGKVTYVASYPFPMRWHGAPMEYGIEVAVIDPPPSIRPGLRAKVQIFFESQPDVLQIPLAAVIVHNDAYYCLVKELDDWRAQQVEIGPSNNEQVVVLQGLIEGDEVALTPFRFIERADLPETPTSVIADGSQQRPDTKMMSSTDVNDLADRTGS